MYVSICFEFDKCFFLSPTSFAYVKKKKKRRKKKVISTTSSLVLVMFTWID